MQEFDVIIAGSGPAGATCAKVLKAEGLSVLVLEKEVLPRHKTCSGVLFGQTQELLKNYFGVETPAEVFCSNRYIEADNIWEWTADKGYIPYTWEIDKDGKPFSRTYHNIWRNKFDKWLLDQSGAPYCDRARVKGVSTSGNAVEVEVQISGETDILRCQYLVGADGNDSTVRRLLAPWAPPGQEAIKLASFQSYYKVTSYGSLKKDGWTVFLEPEIGDYILCVHQKDEYLVLHVGGGEGRSLRVSMHQFKALLTDRFGVIFDEHWRDEGCKCQLLPHFLGTEQVLLTGEAAGFIYLNCEGISAAMDSGYRCGTAIARALSSDGGSAAKLYADSCQDIFAHQAKCMSQMHFLATAPPSV